MNLEWHVLDSVEDPPPSTMSRTLTDTALVESSTDISSSQALGSSIGSLSSSSPRGTTQIAKAYTQASNLFLTRRLTEALSTLTPIIEKPLVEDIGESPESAPIASSSRSSRIKIWSLYLTLLNAIIELGPEEGKATFGSNGWRDIDRKSVV